MPRPHYYGSLEARLIGNTVLCIYTECWIWLGRSIESHGGTRYPRINLWLDGKTLTKRAHRIAWEEWRGPIPEGFEIDHLCHNTLCINPAHLDCVPPLENQKHKRKGVSRV